MKANSYLKGENIAPRYLGDAKKLVGKKVKYLLNRDIDKSGRGYYFPKTATITDAKGRNLSFDGDWQAFRDIVEIQELTT